MALNFPDLPEWAFEIAEVSANVYRVCGRHAAGPAVEMTGTDPDELLELCRRYALELSPVATNASRQHQADGDPAR